MLGEFFISKIFEIEFTGVERLKLLERYYGSKGIGKKSRFDEHGIACRFYDTDDR